MKSRVDRILLSVVIVAGLAAAGPVRAADYLAGQASPQNNSWAGKNEGTDPPVSYNSFQVGFYGAWWTYAKAHRGRLYNSTGTSKGVPWNFKSFANFRFDDLVFTCADGRSQVTYRARVMLSASVTQNEGAPPGPAGLAIGDPDCPWGSCANHWGGWSSRNGGSGPLAGLPPGSGFSPTLITGPARTATTGVPSAFSLSLASSANDYYGGNGYRWLQIETNASFPTDVPVFDLPEGCTCNSAEGNIVNNVWRGVDLAPPTVSVSGTITSDCDGPLAGVTVNLVDADGISMSTTTAADGSYSFPTVNSSATGEGTVEVVAPEGFDPVDHVFIPLDVDAVFDGTLMCTLVDVAGTVTSDCDGLLEGIEITLTDGNGGTSTATTGPDGSYAFTGVRYDTDPGQVAVTMPPGYLAPSGSSAIVDLTAGGTQDFALVCQLVDVAGVVSSACSGALAGITVDLMDAEGGFHTTVTDASGAYAFPDLRWSDAVDAAEVSIMIPLGYEAIVPGVAGASLTLDQDRIVDFSLGCLDPTGAPRSIGYWKHQANVYLNGRGNAKESLADMSTNFPQALFDHFHENQLNGIQVEGVTYLVSGGNHSPLDLATIRNTLTVNKGATKLDRAKQHYLILLLNVASGKLSTSSIVSADGATVSQALQQIAAYILDGDPGNDQMAKDIGTILNNAETVPAGVIDPDIANIAYRRGGLGNGAVLLRAAPSPFRAATTVRFRLDTPAAATVDVFDARGRLVRRLYDGWADAGSHEVTWKGDDVSGSRAASGIYFIRMVAGGRANVSTVVFVR